MSEVKLRLLLDDFLPPIECDARVVWMIPGKELSSPKMHYDTGFEFTHLDSKDRERIQTFVQKLSPQK